MTIQMGEYNGRTIKCYTCSGESECGITFSTSNMEHHSREGNEQFYSCSISVNSEGITTRDLVPSSTCRSSSYQFCCKDNFCNSLPSPPLPAFTNLTCIVGRCLLNGNTCDDSRHVAFRSSAAESCSLIQQDDHEYIYKSYQKACFPGLNIISAKIVEAYINIESSCCNSFNCNDQSLPNDIAIECYVCDSRITGLTGCSILNKSSSHVYKFGSSSPSESCATIVGLPAQDTLSNITYPAFTIRTYIADCRNQPLGVVSYGGATFQGRISCCQSNYCNKEPLDIYLTPGPTTATVPTVIRTMIKGTTTTDKVIQTTTTTTITTATKTTKTTTTAATETTTVTIERTIENAGIKAKTTASTKTGSGSHILKISAIISVVVVSCGLAIGILRVTRRLNCRTAQSRDRNHPFTDSVEEIPISSPLEPSSQPFIQNYYELS